MAHQARETFQCGLVVANAPCSGLALPRSGRHEVLVGSLIPSAAQARSHPPSKIGCLPIWVSTLNPYHRLRVQEIHYKILR